MADLTLTGFARQGDKITLTGTGFTKTTTTVFVDDASVPFEWVSDTEISIEAVDEGTISAEKGGVTSQEFDLAGEPDDEAPADAPEPASGETEPEGHTADTSTTAEGEDEVADATKSELAGAANAGATAAPASASLKEAPDPKTAPHLEAEGFRATVENTPAGDLNMDPREPYPTGNPPDPREAFHRMHGYYPEKSDDAV